MATAVELRFDTHSPDLPEPVRLALRALAGVSAGIQRVAINGSDIWYRVRVGPFNNLTESPGRAPAPHGGSLQYMLVKVEPGEGGPASAASAHPSQSPVYL